MLSAKQIEDIKEKAFICEPAQFRNICYIHPYTVAEAIKLGTTTFNSYLGLLTLTEVDIAETIKEKTQEEVNIEQIHPLEYLLMSASLDDTFLLDLQKAFTTFIKEEVLLLPKIKSVLVGSPADKRLITEENFRDFQDILRIQNNKEITEPPPENESFGQRKMRLLREKVAAVKKKQQNKNSSQQSLVELMEIAEIFGVSAEHSLYSYYKIIRRHQLKEKWDQDLQMLCAGADSSKLKIQYWGENSNE